jgi:hypothetical protein
VLLLHKPETSHSRVCTPFAAHYAHRPLRDAVSLVLRFCYRLLNWIRA